MSTRTDRACSTCSHTAPDIESAAIALYERRRDTARAADGIIRPAEWEDLPHATRHTRRADAAAALAAADDIRALLPTR